MIYNIINLIEFLQSFEFKNHPPIFIIFYFIFNILINTNYTCNNIPCYLEVLLIIETSQGLFLIFFVYILSSIIRHSNR